jgi:hypothetical protein
MESDYTLAIFSMVALVVVLTAMTVYMLSRPSDLGQRRSR